MNMTQAKQITGPMPYASCEDFCRVFDEDMNSVYQLAFLLTADRERAEQCFVSGLEDAIDGNPSFKEWARSWARRTVILNARRLINPRPAEGNVGDPSSTDSLNNKGNALPAEQQAEVATVLALEPFERFVYVITVLERYSDQDCCVLLGHTRRDVLAARTRAFQQIGIAMELHYQQPRNAGLTKPDRSSGLQFRIAPHLEASA